MSESKMKQVAVRMTPQMHRNTLRAAKRSKISFGEWMRRAAEDRLYLDATVEQAKDGPHAA